MEIFSGTQTAAVYLFYPLPSCSMRHSVANLFARDLITFSCCGGRAPSHLLTFFYPQPPPPAPLLLADMARTKKKNRLPGPATNRSAVPATYAVRCSRRQCMPALLPDERVAPLTSTNHPSHRRERVPRAQGALHETASGSASTVQSMCCVPIIKDSCL
jgi:hypothetical protein